MAETNTNTTVTETINKAENSGGDPKQAVSPKQDEKAVSTNEGAEKTFTQAELDEIVRQRLERQKKGQPTKEEMDAFHKWQDSQKTAEQLSAEKISAAESRATEAEKKAAAAEAKAYAYSKGVNAEAVDDVIALAIPKVDDNITMEKAIEAVIAKYPSFCSAKSEAPKCITTGVSFGNGSGGSQLSGVEAAFYAKNPDLKI